jgi:hypothetical protein
MTDKSYTLKIIYEGDPDYIRVQGNKLYDRDLKFPILLTPHSSPARSAAMMITPGDLN